MDSYQPLVSIVVATYFPNENFFRKQLQSLNGQIYTNIEVIICDDSADDEQFTLIKRLIEEEITRCQPIIIRNEYNMGSNATFERLTGMATGEYICYCDQDDIWLLHKVDVLVKKMEEHPYKLIYSDLSLIDENDKVTHQSFRDNNFRLKHVYGNGTFDYLINRYSVTGCAMMVPINLVKRAIPFPSKDLFVHDYWLSIWASVSGTIAYIKEPLVLYRMHHNNQIGSQRLANVMTIEDYVNYRIIRQIERYQLMLSIPMIDEYKEKIEEQLIIVNNRKLLANKFRLSTIISLKGLLKRDPVLFLFELVLFNIPIKYSNRLLGKLKS